MPRPKAAEGRSCAAGGASGRPPPAQSAGAASKNPWSERDADALGLGAARARGAPPPQPMAQQPGDEALSQLSGIVSGLCAQATAMNAEIHSQSGTIDAALTSADAHQAGMAKSAARSKKLVGSSSWW